MWTAYLLYGIAAICVLAVLELAYFWWVQRNAPTWPPEVNDDFDDDDDFLGVGS